MSCQSPFAFDSFYSSSTCIQNRHSRCNKTCITAFQRPFRTHPRLQHISSRWLSHRVFDRRPRFKLYHSHYPNRNHDANHEQWSWKRADIVVDGSSVWIYPSYVDSVLCIEAASLTFDQHCSASRIWCTTSITGSQRCLRRPCH